MRREYILAEVKMNWKYTDSKWIALAVHCVDPQYTHQFRETWDCSCKIRWEYKKGSEGRKSFQMKVVLHRDEGDRSDTEKLELSVSRYIYAGVGG